MRGERLRETLPLPMPWVKPPKRDVRACCCCPHRDAATTRDPSCKPTQHPSCRDTTAGFDRLQPSHFTLKYLIYPSKSQNLCLWCLCFSEFMLVIYFILFLAFLLCVYVFVSLWIVTLCLWLSLLYYIYIYIERERERESLEIRDKSQQ